MELKEEFKKRAVELLGNDAKDYFSILEKPLSDSFRVNTIKITNEALIKRLESNGWNLKQVPFYKDGYFVYDSGGSLGNTIEHFLGYYYLQDVGSMIPPLLMELKEGQKVLDMCASPGSKTGEIASIINDEGLIIANDVSVDRTSILKYNTQRMGVRSIIITRRDGNNFSRMPDYFDRVLLDAPCSGEGIIRKNPYVALQWNVHAFPKFTKLQKMLINSAYTTLKPGGIMVYSTCSLAPEEDEEVVQSLLNKFPNATIEPARVHNLKVHEGVTNWHGLTMDSSIKNCARVYPQDNDTEGFFVAKIRKGDK